MRPKPVAIQVVTREDGSTILDMPEWPRVAEFTVAAIQSMREIRPEANDHIQIKLEGARAVYRIVKRRADSMIAELVYEEGPW